MSSPLSFAAISAGTLATTAYLDAKFLISNDLSNSPFSVGPKQLQRFFEERKRQDKLLNYHILEEQALRRNPNNEFLIFEGRSWTYRQFYDIVTRVGNWLLKGLDIQRDEIVAIDGSNSAEYVILWFALEAINAPVSFINSNLSGRSLEHCVKVYLEPCIHR